MGPIRSLVKDGSVERFKGEYGLSELGVIVVAALVAVAAVILILFLKG